MNLQLPFASKKTPPSQTSQPNPLSQFASGMVSTKDLIAPDALEVDFNFIKIGDRYLRTVFIAGYPRFVSANWLSPLINFNHSLDVSMFIYPIEGKGVLDDLRRKITEMEAEINSDIQRGRIPNIETQIKLEDAKSLQEQLAKGAERFYQFGLYITLTADNLEELDHLTKQIQSTLGALLIIAKPATLQMEPGFKTTQPLGQDYLNVTRNMDTTSLATTFPFTSSELTANEGIMYGINEHNDSLVIFDRFTMENANMVVFAKSGAGKSFLVKLESLRSLMFDAEIIVIDPEDEYRRMCESVNGQYIEFSFNAAAKINPFDLPRLAESRQPTEETGSKQSVFTPDNELSQKLLSLHSLMKIMLGEMDATQEAILDRALVACYKAKGITPDPTTQNNEPPLLEDLYKAFIGMEEPQAANLAARLEKFVKGSFRGLFDQRTNVDIKNEFVVFGIKNLEDALRPIAMFMILDFIWTRVKSSLKRRLLVVDEAWYLMKNRDSATFLYSIAKRARKYYLGLTTITQDVEDFLSSDYGKAIVTNSSLQILMKQSAAAVDKLGEVFYLSEGEKQLLLSAEVGEGLFFAGQNHVAIKVLASDDEHKLITSKPQELLEMQVQNTLKTPSAGGSDIPREPDKPEAAIRLSEIPTVRPSSPPSIPSVPKPSPTPSPISQPSTIQPPTSNFSPPKVEFTSIFENPPKQNPSTSAPSPA